MNKTDITKKTEWVKRKMKRFFILIGVIAAVFLFGARAQAACTLGAGSICVVLQDELGNSVIGDSSTRVYVVTEGADNNITDLPQEYFNDMRDGGPLDEDHLIDGDIEISSSSLSGRVDPSGAFDLYYEVKSSSGFVYYYSGYLEYESGSVNEFTAQLQYTIKVTVYSQSPFFQPIVTGAQITVQNSNYCDGTYEDGSDDDKDGLENGEIYVKCPASDQPDQVTFTVEAVGFVDVEETTMNLDNALQIELDTMHDFILKIPAGNIEDNLAVPNQIIPDDMDPITYFDINDGRFGKTEVYYAVSDDGDIYIAADGDGDLYIRYPGYQEQVVAVTPDDSAQDDTIAFNAAGGNALEYQIEIDDGAGNLEDELGNAITFDFDDELEYVYICTDDTSWDTCVSTAVSITMKNDGAKWYIAPNAEVGTYYVGLYKKGFVHVLDEDEIVTEWDSVVSPDFTMADGDSLVYGLKVKLRDELGLDIDPSMFGTFTFDGDTAAQNDGVNTYYFANTTSTNEELVIKPTGFVEGKYVNSGLATVNVSDSGQTYIELDSMYASLVYVTPGAVNQGAGIKYQIKIVGGAGNIESELGYPLTVASGDSVILCTASDCSTTDTIEVDNYYEGALYVAPTNTGYKWVQLNKEGYITEIDGSRIEVTTTAQISPAWVDTNGGDELVYTLKVQVENQFGDAVASASATANVVAGPAVDCHEDLENEGDYYCPVPDGVATDVEVSKAGYITNRAASAGLADESLGAAQLVNTMLDGSGDELEYQIMVNDTDLETEIGEALTLDGTEVLTVCLDDSCNETEEPLEGPTWDGANDVWYIAPATEGEKFIMLYKTGYVSTIDATEIDADASFGSAQAVPNYTEAGGDGLIYQIKIIDDIGYLQDELGNNLGLDGTDEAFTLCLDSSCLDEEVPLNGPDWDAGTDAWYIAPAATGSKWVRIEMMGYVGSTDLTAVAANEYSQMKPLWQDGAGDELKFMIKVLGGSGYLEDEINNILELDGTETLTVCNAVDCPGGSEEPYITSEFDTEESIWYIAPSVLGDKYVKIVKEGFCQQVDDNVVEAKYEGQEFTTYEGTDALQYTLFTHIDTELGANFEDATVIASGGTITCIEDTMAYPGTYYCPVPVGDATDISAAKTGFVTTTSVTLGPAVLAAPLEAAPADAEFQIKINEGGGFLETELGDALTLDGTETIIVCNDNGCGEPESPAEGPTWDAPSDSFYIAPATAGSKWVYISKSGYGAVIDATALTAAAAGPQDSPDFVGAIGDGLRFQIKVQSGSGYFEDEVGTVLAFDGSESVTLCKDSVCAQTEAPTFSTYDSGSWYFSPATTGDKWVKVEKTGYIHQIDISAVNASSSGQVSPTFDADDGDGLQYQVKIMGGSGALESELGNGITLDGTETITFCLASNCGTGDWNGHITGGSPAYVGAVKAFLYSFDALPPLGRLWVRIQKEGFIREIDGDFITVSNDDQVSPDFINGQGDDLTYTLRVYVEDELLSPLRGADLSANGGATTCDEDLSSAGYYVCDVPDGQPTDVDVERAGFIDDSAASAGAASETGPQVSNSVTGVQYQIKVNEGAVLQDELGNNLTFDGTENIYVCNDDDCDVKQTPSLGPTWSAADNAYFIAPQTSGAKYISVSKPGFVETIDKTSITAAVAGPQVSPGFVDADSDPLKYQIVVKGGSGYLEDEIGNPISLVGSATETITVCLDGTCVESEDPLYGPTWDAGTNAWYIGPETEGSKFIKMARKGFIDTVDSAPINVGSGGQLSPGFVYGQGDELKYQIKVQGGDGIIENILGSAITLDGTETLTVCLNATCASSEDPDIGPTFHDGNWYIAPSSTGTEWINLSIPGYRTQIDDDSISVNSTTQVSPAFTIDGDDPFDYTLKVVVKTELGDIRQGVDLTANSGTVECDEDTSNPGDYYCAVEDGDPTDVEGSLLGYSTTATATAGVADESISGSQIDNTLGLEYQIAVVDGAGFLEDETGTVLSLDGTETITVCTDYLCTNTETPLDGPRWDAGTGVWYLAPPTEGNKWVKIEKSGFAQAIDQTPIVADQDNAQQNPTFEDGEGDELRYQIRVLGGEGYIEDELGNGIALTGDPAVEKITICTDSACTGAESPDIGPTWDAGSQGWYLAPGTTGTKWIRIAISGYTRVIDSTAITANTAQRSTPKFLYSDGDFLRHQITVKGGASYLEDEIGEALSLDGTETISVCNDSLCGDAGDPEAPNDIIFNDDTWYIAPGTSGAYKWIQIEKSGYKRSIDGTGIYATASTVVSPAYVDTDGGDELMYTLKVTVTDDASNPRSNINVRADLTAVPPIGCTEDPGNVGDYYCPVPDGRPTDVQGAMTGFVTDSTASVGPADESGATTQATSSIQMLYQIVLQEGDEYLEDELGNALQFDGTETITVCLSDGCSITETPTEGPIWDAINNKYYIAPASIGNKYIRIQKNYFSQTRDTTPIFADTTGQQIPAFDADDGDGLMYHVKVVDTAGYLDDELGNPLTLDGTETISVCNDDMCSDVELPAEGPTWATDSWYLSPDTIGDKYIRIQKTGYVAAIDNTAVTTSSQGQVIPTFSYGDGDELDFQIKVVGGTGYIESEIGQGISLGGSETITVCTNSACTVTEAPLSGPTFYSDAWYIAPATSGSKWIKIQKDGYIPSIDGTSVLANTTAQRNPKFLDTNGGDELQYTLKTRVETELGNGLSSGTVKANNSGTPVTCYEDSSVPGDYYCAVPYDAATDISAAKSGFTSTSVATAGTATDTAQIANNILDGSGDELLYQIVVTGGAGSIEDELGSAVTLSGSEVITVCTSYDCSITQEPSETPTFDTNKWYIAPATTGAKYIRIEKVGYVITIDKSSIIASTAGQVSPVFTGAAGDGLVYQIKVIDGVGYLENEIGGVLDLDGTETLTVCLDSNCNSQETPSSGPTWVAASGTWFIQPSSAGEKWIQIQKDGYIETVDTESITVSTSATVRPAWTESDGDGVQFSVKVTSAQDELGNALDLDYTDSVGVYTNADCSAAGAIIDGPTFDEETDAWYIAVNTGNYYLNYAKSGFVTACDSTSIAPAVDLQASPSFTTAGNDSLKYGLRVTVADQDSRPVGYATILHGASSPAVSDYGTYHNIYYFNTTSAQPISISKGGFSTIDQGPESTTVEPGGGAIQPTYIILGDYTNNLATTTVTAGEQEYFLGLDNIYNVEITVAYDLGAGSTGNYITGLGSAANFYFLNSSGVRVVPDSFFEVDPVNNPGVYYFRVDTSADKVQIKNIDYDDDPWIDLLDSAKISLTGLDEDTLTSYGPVILTPKADHVLLSMDNQYFTAGATAAIYVTVYDNEGATVTVGNDASFRITAEMTGGSTSPASTKDFTEASTLVSPSIDLSGGGDTKVSGSLSGGTANLIVTDSVVTDGSKIYVAVAGYEYELPQNMASNTTALDISVVASDANQIYVADPTDATIDDTVAVSIQLQDAYGNVIDTVYTISVSVDGSAMIDDSETGDFSSNITNVTTSGGLATVYVIDEVAETVNITATDTGAPPVFTVSNTQDLVFGTGEATKIVITGVSATTQTVGLDIDITGEVRDAGDNLVSGSSAVFTINAVGDGSNNPEFTEIVTGTVLPQTTLPYKSAIIMAESGEFEITLSDNSAENVTITLQDHAGIGLDMTSTIDVEFEAGDPNRLVVSNGSTSITAGGSTSAFKVEIQDTTGNQIELGTAMSIDLDTDSSNGVFSATSGGAPVTSIEISAGNSEQYFYYTDTSAGDVEITVSTDTSGVSSDSVDLIVYPDAPINVLNTGNSVSETSFTDSEQPTESSYRQTVSNSNGSYVMIEYPYTNDSNYQIVANGLTGSVIRIWVKDKYGNPVEDQKLSFLVSNISSVTITPSTLSTDEDGYAQVSVKSSVTGEAIITTVLSDPSYSYYYGQSMSINFKNDDRTPPKISRYDTETIVDGDLIDPTGPVRVHVILDDQGENPVGIDLTVTDTVELQVVDADTQIEVTGGTTDTTGCNHASEEDDCLVEWYPPYSLSAGSYEVSLIVRDRNDNVAVETWTVVVDQAPVIREVLSGPGIFDPRNGLSNPLIISFQLPVDDSFVTLEVYNRTGKLVYTASQAGLQAGYNKFEWDGRTLAGNLPGNGIYMFRLTARLGNGQTTTQTGKLAVFKP